VTVNAPSREILALIQLPADPNRSIGVMMLQGSYEIATFTSAKHEL
jgi:hypothetical protein